jgi:hypothetical protein
MSETKKFRITEILENAKPSTMEPEKKEKVLRNIKRTLMVATIAIPTAAVVTLVKYYSSIPTEIDNSTED